MRRNFADRWASFAALAAVIVGSPLWVGGQDRDGVRGVREQDAAAERTANQLNATTQGSAASQGQLASGTDLLIQAGIVLDARNPNRMIVERVTPNTPAFMSGLRPGDVITRVNGSPVTSLAAVAQALVNGTGGRLGLQVDRNGQSRQLNLTLTDNSLRTAMRPGLNANTPAANAANQNNAAAGTTVGGVPIQGVGTPGVVPSGVTPGLGTTTARSAGGQANATGQPSGVGQGIATAPGQAGRAIQGTTQGTTGSVTGTTVTTGGQPTTTTGNPPTLPGTPTSPSLPGNPTSPSLQVQPGGIQTALPGLPTAVPGLPTAAQGTVPSVPSSQGTVNPTIGGGSSPPATGVGSTGTGASPATSSQGSVTPGVGGGTTSGAGAGAVGTGGIGSGATTGSATGAAGAGAGTSGGAAGAAGGTGGAAGGAGTGGGAGGAGGGAGAGGT